MQDMLVFTCTWNEALDLDAHFQKLGMVIEKVNQRPEASTEIVFTGPPELIAEITKMSAQNVQQEAKKTGLAAILDEMCRAAAAAPGQVQRNQLKNGMGIDVIIFNNVLRLQIWREDVSPSDVEWRTTCNHFPVVLASRDPERFTYHRRYYLRAAWNASNPQDENPV